MNEGKNPIQSLLVRFVVGGSRRGQGIVLLYPDKLAAVTTWAQLCGLVIGPIALVAIAYPFFHVIGTVGVLIGVTAGGSAGAAIDKRTAARKVAAGRGGVTVIPLDTIAGVQTRKAGGIDGWFRTRSLLVATADGTEFGFRGRTDRLQADLASALSLRGREVRVTPQGITVTHFPVS